MPVSYMTRRTGGGIGNRPDSQSRDAASARASDNRSRLSDPDTDRHAAYAWSTSAGSVLSRCAPSGPASTARSRRKCNSNGISGGAGTASPAVANVIDAALSSANGPVSQCSWHSFASSSQNCHRSDGSTSSAARTAASVTRGASAGRPASTIACASRMAAPASQGSSGGSRRTGPASSPMAARWSSTSSDWVSARPTYRATRSRSGPGAIAAYSARSSTSPVSSSSASSACSGRSGSSQ